MELIYSMAALGAQYVGEYEHLANAYYIHAVECLENTKTIVRSSADGTLFDLFSKAKSESASPSADEDTLGGVRGVEVLQADAPVGHKREGDC